MAPGTLATDPPASLGAELRRARWRGRYLALSPSALALVVTVPPVSARAMAYGPIVIVLVVVTS